MDRYKFQLRNYHIRRGRPKDSTPLYPVTKAEYIIGDVSGVTKVTSLPETGEAGKIYYNTTDNKYYLYNGTSYSPIGSQGMPIGETPENTSITPSKVDYTLAANTFYNLDTFYTTSDDEVPKDATFRFDGIASEDAMNTYVFRMTVPDAGVPNMTFNYVIIPDSTKEVLDALEEGHTYEFNVFGNVMLVTDITQTT